MNEKDWPLGLAMAVVWFGTWGFGIYFAFTLDIGAGFLLLLLVGVVTYLFIRGAVRRYG